VPDTQWVHVTKLQKTVPWLPQNYTSSIYIWNMLTAKTTLSCILNVNVINWSNLILIWLVIKAECGNVCVCVKHHTKSAIILLIAMMAIKLLKICYLIVNNSFDEPRS
jgi:hypothetical protein